MLSLESLEVILPALAVALAMGFLFGRTGRRGLLREQDRLHQMLEQAQRQNGNDQSKRTIAKMRRELDTVANLALAMPRVVRALNRDDVELSEVPRLILKLADAVFDPKQVLLYGIRNEPDSQKRVLALSAQRGLIEIPDSLKTVRLGEGKIGWVAKHELDMLKDDWKALQVTDRLEVLDNHSTLQGDIMGPLVHHRKQKQTVLGVLCIGSPRIRPRDEKLMFQMVTNFASLAIVSTSNMNRLRDAAHHDGLTSLMNKRWFLEDVACNLLISCEKGAKPFSVFIFDIDHFKNFNDTNGHPAGDTLLRGMGALIRRQLRPGDVACRYGGGEFVIAMPNTDRATALEVAERLRAAIESEPFEHRESQPAGTVSVSGGVAQFPKDGATVAELIQRADQSLYRAKKGGRNRIVAYRGVEIGDTGDLPPLVDGSGDSAAEDGSTIGR